WLALTASTHAATPDWIFSSGFEKTVPYPVATHPRLWITANDIARLRGWAVPSNTIYQNGMLPLVTQADQVYKTYSFPGGVAASPWPDAGDLDGYGLLSGGGGPALTSNTEQWAVVLAFNSLIDPDPDKRILYAQEARNLLMVVMNVAAQGIANAPFRYAQFATYNHANGTGEQWPLIVDWIYDATDGSGNPILSASDKLTIRDVFLLWSQQIDDVNVTGGYHPSTPLLPNNKPYRYASNNYFLGHARLLTMMALAIDPQDDPPLDTHFSSAQVGNTLRSY